MNPTPLKDLHNTFADALNKHIYLAPNKQGSLEASPQKTIRLQEVYKQAEVEILTALNTTTESLNDQVTLLNWLEKDGETQYARYEAKTNELVRVFLKGIARYTPAILKKILPRCFSNQMELAEQDTKKAYDDFRTFLRNRITDLSKKPAGTGTVSKPVQASQSKTAPQTSRPKAAPKKPSSKDPKVDPKDPRQAAANAARQRATTGQQQSGGKKNEWQPDISEDEALARALSESLNDSGDDLEIDTHQSTSTTQVHARSNEEEDDVIEPENKPSPPTKSASKAKPTSQTKSTSQAKSTPPSKSTTANKPAPAQNKPAPIIAPPIKKNKPAQDKLQCAEIKAVDILAKQDKIFTEDMQTLGQLVKDFDQKSASNDNCKRLLKSMTLLIGKWLKIDPAKEESMMKQMGVKEEIFAVLKQTDALLEALAKETSDDLLALFNDTDWKASVEKAVDPAQQTYVRFGCQRLGGQQQLRLVDEKGTRVQENKLHDYKSAIHISSTLGELQELLKIIEAKDTCRPSELKVDLTDKTFTPKLIKVLFKLSQYIPDIYLTGLKTIDFKELSIAKEGKKALTANQEHQFVQKLSIFHCPDLEEMTLSDHPKTDWLAKEFSQLLHICPTLALFKQCFHACAEPQNMDIPESLEQSTTTLNLKDYPAQYIPYLLSSFPLTSVDLSGLGMTDAHLEEWITNGYLNRVISLNLTDCHHLTTDILTTLMQLPALTQLQLPDLDQGQKPLDQLPVLEDPFKVKLFYTSCIETQSLANKLYSGPLLWAAVFQIPLARANVKEIFPVHQKRLDPKSVAYWLHQDEFKKLTPQPNVKTIFADFNAGLNDDNLIEFVQKFPGSIAISLYGCPHITNKGIIQLVKTCPHITSLDLTGCTQINEQLFFSDEGTVDDFNSIQRIIISGTGFSPETAEVLKESLGKRLEFQETTLTITDDQLGDEDSLEAILAATNLSQLRRINLTDCTKLTDQMLGILLDRYNTDRLIQAEDQTWYENPQYLNAAVLNLTNCSQITGKAFDGDLTEEGKVNPKILNNLRRVVTGGTKIAEVLSDIYPPIAEVLSDIYPRIVFQEKDEPITITIDPDTQVKDCALYLNSNEHHYLARHFIHNRIAVELFAGECTDKDLLEAVLSHSIDSSSDEFCDMQLNFQATDDSELFTYPVHRDVLYTSSLYFVNYLRPGGWLSQQDGATLINQHATRESTQAIRDLFYTKDPKSIIDHLHWKVAADVAEFVGPANFDLPKAIFYDKLLERIHAQISIEDADAMLLTAAQLKDEKGLKKYEEFLSFFLESYQQDIISNGDNIRNIVRLANQFGLKELYTKAKAVEDRLTTLMVQQQLIANDTENERKTQAFLDQEAANQRQINSGTLLNQFYNALTRP